MRLIENINYNIHNEIACIKDDGMEHIQLYTKLNYLPNDLKSEVNDFIDFLLSKRKKEIKKRTPKFGCAQGQIYLSPDFDEPLDYFIAK